MKARIEPYLSLRSFSFTLAGLVALSLLVAMGLGLTGKTPALPSVTVPLGPATTEAMSQSSAAGTLKDEDRTAAEPVESAIAPPPVVVKKRAPVEDAVAGLAESTPYGMVPVVRKSDGLSPYKAYRADFTALPATKALISLVMVDYGLSKSASAQALKDLPDGVSVALSPYSADAQTWVTDARQAGHEVWLGLPVQNGAYGGSDSGNQTLLVNASIEQNKTRLLTNLGKATGYVGVIDFDTPAFASNAADLDHIYSDLLDRGLALAQGNPADTVTGTFAASHKAPFIHNDSWLDRNATPAAVILELDKLKQLALNGRVAVGFFHPYPAVIAAIRDWQAKLDAANIQLAPMSASIEQK